MSARIIDFIGHGPDFWQPVWCDGDEDYSNSFVNEY